MPLTSLPLSSPLLTTRDRRNAAAWALTLPEVAAVVLNFLPNAGLIARARGISRAWWGIGTILLSRLFDIDRNIGRFFEDVINLRRFQCEHDMLISGSFTLGLFRWSALNGTPTHPVNADMDLYIEYTYRDDIDALMTNEGYTMIGEFANFSATARDLGASIPDWSFETVLRYERDDRHVDVVCTRATPVYCIFSFHSSVVMNFIAWDRAVCMFPRETLLEHTGIVFRLNNDRTRRAIDKYSRRGFAMQHWVETSTHMKATRYWKEARWVGDSKCFSIRLATKHVEYGIDPDTGEYDQIIVPSPYCWEANGFLLDYWRAEGPVPRRAPASDNRLWLPAMDVQPICHDGLMYSYAGSSSFKHRVLRFLRTTILTHGSFWIAHAYVDDDMPRLKEEQIAYDAA